MDNRNRDKMSKDSPSNTSSNIGKKNSDSESSFGQGIGRSESWDSEPSRRSGIDSDSDLENSESDRGSSGSSSRH